MKLRIKLCLAIAVMMTVACTKTSGGSSAASSPKSMNGGETGNGGDHIAQDFVISAQEGLKFLRQHASEYPFIDLNKIENAINTAKVVMLVPKTSFHDAVRTAENFPQKNEIQVDGDRWNQIAEPIRKMALSLHEYLGLTNYEVNNYIVTSQLFSITSDQMEDPPTIEQLDHSFDSVRDQDMHLLSEIKKLQPTAVTGALKELNLEECKALFATYQESIDLSSYEVCYDKSYASLSHIQDAHSYLISQSGVNSFGVHFSKVFRYYVKLDWKSYATQTDYFLDESNRVIESVTSYASGNFSATDMTVVDQNGSGYQHDIRNDKTQNHNLIEEYVALVSADGSTGNIISESDLYDQSGKVFRKLTLARANSKDWQKFEIHLRHASMDLCQPDYFMYGCTNNQDDSDGGFEYSYGYLGYNFKSPDNYRTVTYLDSPNGYSMRRGTYVANRRSYLASDLSSTPNEFTLMNKGDGHLIISSFIDTWKEYTQGVKSLRFYYSMDSFRNVTTSSQFIDVPVNNEGQLDLSQFDKVQLQKNNIYYFKIAVIGNDGQIIYMTSDLDVDYGRNSLLIQ